MTEDYLKKNKIYVHPDSVIISPCTIGYGTYINGKISVMGISACSIGKYCAIGPDVKILTAEHVMNMANIQARLQKRIGGNPIQTSKGDVVIGNNVWIGDSAILLSGVTIGDGAVIGAGSIVTKNVGPFSVVAGTPARKLRMRFNDTIIRQLLDIQWWNWTEEKMRRNLTFFNMDLTALPDEANLQSFIVE
ncbi:MAG: CatB-related O-acetyltransferase [Thermodesulfovibrionales bacterium]|nr:CatB-related O-acetyltransferase [Thermodesulfovibrionales bacterium]